MADDWKVGDLALCVDDTNLAMGLIRKGAIYRVTDISHGIHVKFGPQVALHFEGVDDFMGHAAIRFRKINPLSDEERTCFLADLDTPVSTPEPSEVAPVDAALTARVGHPQPEVVAPTQPTASGLHSNMDQSAAHAATANN